MGLAVSLPGIDIGMGRFFVWRLSVGLRHSGLPDYRRCSPSPLLPLTVDIDFSCTFLNPRLSGILLFILPILAVVEPSPTT